MSGEKDDLEKLTGEEAVGPKGATMTARPFEINSAEVPLANDSLLVPALYADSIRGVMVSEGIAKINLVEVRVSTLSGEAFHSHVATLIIPASQMRQWAALLEKTANEVGA
jgi:hypothetical protein